MAAEVELRKWLNRPNKDFLINLQFGIKAWNSIEFNLITKHEIITEEFCRNLSQFRKTLKHNLDQYFDAWHTTINEFLSLNCSPGAINSTVKCSLIDALKSEAKKLKHNPHPSLLNGMLLVLHNVSMQSFYKSNAEAYCEFIAAILKYINGLSSTDDTIPIKDQVSQILDGIQTYVRQTPHLDTFQIAFLRNILKPLSELVIKLQMQKNLDFNERFIEILKELFFGDQTIDGLKNWLNTSSETSIYTQLFDVPSHTFLLLIETIFHTYRYDVSLQTIFIRWLFDNYFSIENDKFSDTKELFNVMAYVMHLIRKHDVRLNFNIDQQKAIAFIGKHLELLFNELYENAFNEMIMLIIATLQTNPMILEHALLPIVVKCMLMPKERSTTTMSNFVQMMQLVIDIYRRLSKSEKFVSQLIRSVYDALTTTKLSTKQLKRKQIDGIIANSSKKSKKFNGHENGHNIDTGTDEPSYLNILLSKYQTQIELTEGEDYVECVGIEFAWPSPVGRAFSKFISSLVSKPSIVVCKTLTFTLRDYVNLLKDSGHNNNENTMFLIEFTSALLSQYFIGTRLAEHAEKQNALIEENRQRTHLVLKEFGMAILNQEHNIRTMNSFLKTCFHASNFDLLCLYYRIDTKTIHVDGGNTLEMAKLADNIHPYLRAQEWTLIEQRITNFGRDECKANMNRLYLQKIKSALLLGKVKKQSISNHLISATLTDLTQITLLLHDDANIGQWFLETLTIAEMRMICDLLLTAQKTTDNSLSMKILQYFCDNRFGLEILILSVLKKFCQVTGICETKVNVETKDIHKLFYKEICYRIRDANGRSSSEELDKDEIETISAMFEMLKQLPIGFVDVDVKNVLFMMNAVICMDKQLTGDEYPTILKQSLHVIKELLYFGDLPTIFNDKSFTIFDLQALFGINDVEIYHLIFGKIAKNLDKSNTKMLTNYLNDFEKKSHDDTTLSVCIILLEYLSKERKCRELYSKCREVVLSFITEYYKIHKDDKENNNKTIKFIQLTLSGFTTIISSILSTRSGNNAEPLDADLIQIFHWYFSRLSNFNDIAAIKLLNIAINYKDVLNTTAEQIDLIIKHYWQRLIIDTTINHIDERIELFLKILLNYTSIDETFVLFSKIVDARNSDGSMKLNTFQHFSTIAKLQLSKAKGHMFVESFKKYFLQINLSKQIDKTLSTSNQYDMKLLQCQRLIVDNVQLPVSIQFIDDALALLSEINLKKIKITTANTTEEINQFVLLHTNAADLCFSLIQYRSVFIVNRVPQFCAIYKDLLQTICLYRNDRARDENLSNSEITMLAEQSHKLENIMKALIKHAKDVKRIAPYLLIFVLNLYTTNERPTTLYPKIKTYIDNICYDLISVCDHRVEGFIMRCCNESSKQLYEQFVKEYNKYHKFKGKV